MKTTSIAKSATIFFALFVLVSCGGTQSTSTAQPEPTEQEEQAEQDAPVEKLSRKYDNILFSTFTLKPELAKDYPEAAGMLQQSMMTALQEEKTFAKVDTAAEAIPPTGNTLLIKAEITDMRIVSDAARIWGGAFAGSSGVEIYLQLLDSATGKIVRKKKMSSWNNPFAAAWSAGSTDHSLLDDMGKIVARYVVESMPEK